MNNSLEPTNVMNDELRHIVTEPRKALPESWEWVSLGEVAEINPRRNNISNEDTEVTFLKMADVSEEGKISTRQTRQYSAVKSGFTSFAENDLLIAKITPCFENGKGALAKGLLNGIGFGSTEFHVLRAGNRVLVDILFYHSLSNEFREKGEQKMTGSAGQKRVPTDFLRTYLIPLPPLAEQQRIANILTKWDEGIEKLQIIIDKAKKRKEGLMQQLLTGTKRFAEFEGQFVDEVRFGDIFSYIRNESHSRDCLTYEETENQIYYIHYGDIHATFDTSILDFSKETRIPQLKDNTVLSKQSAFLRDGDLLIADASEDYEGIGECVEVKNLGNKVAVGGLHTIIARDSRNRTAPGFRNYLLMHPEVAIAIRKVANGISVYGLSKTSLSNISIYLPSLAEQRRIAAVLSAADLEIEGLTQELTLMKQQKRGLMQGLLAGDISTKNLNLNPHD